MKDVVNAGSSPANPASFKADLAQLVEHLICRNPSQFGQGNFCWKQQNEKNANTGKPGRIPC